MSDTDVKQLLLQVDATVELLRKNLTDGEKRVAAFERSVEQSMARTDRSFLKLGTGLTGVGKAVGNVQSKMNGYVGSLKATAAAAAIAFATGGAIEATRRALDYASSLGEVSQQLGVTTSDLQFFRYAATQVGVEQEEMDKGLQKLTRSLGEAAAGAKKPQQALRDLGFSTAEIGKLAAGTAGDALPKLADGFAKIETPAERARLEVALFGKTGQQLDTLLAGGSAAILELRDAYHALGMELTPEQIARADDAADTLAKLNKVLEARVAGIVADNADAILRLANALSIAASEASRFMQQARGLATIYDIEGFKGVANATPDLANAYGAQQNQYGLYLGAVMKQEDRVNTLRRNAKSHSSASVRNASAAQLPKAEAQLASYRASLAKASTAATATMFGQVPLAPAAQNAVPVTNSSRGGGKSGPTAAEIEASHQQELARLNQDALRAKLALTTDVRTRAQIEHEMLNLEIEQRSASIEADKNLSRAQKDEQLARLAKVSELEAARINRTADRGLEEEALALSTAENQNKRDLLQSSADLIDTRLDRLDVEKKLLDLLFEQEIAEQDAVIANKDASDTQKQIADARRKVLEQIKANAAEELDRRYESPGDRYLRDVKRNGKEMNDAMERVAVDGLENLNDELADAIMGAKSLGDVFNDVASSIIRDLLRIAVQQALIKPLAEALFGEGGEGSGGGGIFGNIIKGAGALFGGGSGGSPWSMSFGGFRERGGDVEAGKAYVVGEKRPEIFVPRISGKILTGTGGGGNSVSLGITINAPGATAETVAMIRREIGNAAPQIVAAARNVTIASANRPRLP